jgi:hypothetical protein
LLNSKISNTFAVSKKGSIMRVFTKGKANLLMAFVFIWYFCGISLNPHTHIVDGSVVAHSHPFSKDGHTHTSSQVQTIYELSHYQVSGTPEIIELPVLIRPFVCLVETVVEAHKVQNSIFGVKTLRAPPVMA